jgi:hypothetical protein
MSFLSANGVSEDLIASAVVVVAETKPPEEDEPGEAAA